MLVISPCLDEAAAQHGQLSESINHLHHCGMILLALNFQEKAFKVFERTVQLRKNSPQIKDFIFAAIRDGAKNWSVAKDKECQPSFASSRIFCGSRHQQNRQGGCLTSTGP